MRKKKVCPEESPLKDRLPSVRIPASTIVTDPQGSYTGVPVDQMEIPVQDADDL